MNDVSTVREKVAPSHGEGSDEARRPVPSEGRSEPAPGSSPDLLGLFPIGLFMVLYFARAVVLPFVLLTK